MKYNKRFESFLDVTESARALAEKCRDYYDHRQWSDSEIEKLKLRRQAPIVVNRIQPKIDALKGLLINQRQDPKAYPRTPKHEKASHAITDALRYVHDAVDFDGLEEQCAEDFWIEGTCANIAEINPKDQSVEVKRIPWDRFYYDPYSRELDFSDAKWMGIVIWMDLEDAIEMFPDKEELLTQLVNMTSVASDTFEDKPIWVDRHRKRIRICQEFSKEKSVWQQVYYTYENVLEEGPSPYLDEDEEPTNPISAVSAYIDREVNRYGPCRFWLDLQDEVNHRRSKALHLLSQRQTISRRGAIQDIQKAKNELAKPDGHVEYDGDKGDFDILPTGDMASGQFSLLNEAKQELDALSVNAQLSGERQGAISGRAVESLQAGGMLELAPSLAALHRWRRATFRQIWYRIKQFWTEEKWIRVTDDYNNLKWVGLNHKVTVGEMLEERAKDESLAPDIRQAAAQLLQSGDPRLQQIEEVRNEVAGLGVDIILDSMPDTLTIQNEQFNILADLARTRPEIPFGMLLKLSQVRGKDEILEEIQAQQAAQVKQAQELQQLQLQVEQMKAQLEMAETKADIDNTTADTLKKQVEAQQKEIENAILLNRPITSTSVSV